jgi:hypothetical protein
MHVDHSSPSLRKSSDEFQHNFHCANWSTYLTTTSGLRNELPLQYPFSGGHRSDTRTVIVGCVEQIIRSNVYWYTGRFGSCFGLQDRQLIWNLFHLRKSALERKTFSQRFSNCGAPPWWALSVLRGLRVVCMRDVFILKETEEQGKIYSGRHFARLKYLTYHSVPVLAPNYKQHILSLVKVRFLSVLQHAV